MYSKYTGVILKKYPLGETDELLTFYTRQTGKLRALARGVHRLNSRLAGSLQGLNEIEFETASSSRRPDSGRGLPVLISARVKMLNDYLRQNLKKYAFALVAIETLYRLTADGQENPEVYEELLKFLRRLGESADESSEVRRFQVSLLKVLGFAPGTWNEEQIDAAREKEIDQLLDEVLEREIKAKNFANSLNIKL